MRVFRAEERGQVIVLMALTMATLLLVAGLAVDSGRLFVARRSQQAAADAGAWAGAVALQSGASAAAARDAAILDVQRNGYTAGGDVSVTVNLPPASGEHAGNAAFVEVIVGDAVVPVFFAGTRSVSARAVGGVTAAGGGGSFGEGLLALSGIAIEGVNVSGVDTLTTVLGGGVHSNSSSVTALTLSGAASLTADTIRAVGGAIDLSLGSYTPRPETRAAPRPDPFLFLAGPSTDGLATRADPLAIAGTVRIGPGVYSSITVSGTASLAMDPGVYVVRGPVSIAGLGRLTGSGVTVYTTYSNYPAAYVPGTPCGTVSIATDLALSAPESGPLYGMLLFHDRNCLTAMTLHANGDASRTSLTGTIYAPKAALTVNAVLATSTITTQIVADTIALPTGVLTIDVRDRSKLARPGLPALVE